jgi:GntR family transcriptional regulator/MocR family aminotransferase
MGYGDPLGLPALREALAGYLRVVRSVKCTPEQIMIVSGSQQALALSSQVLLEPGDAVWLEEPGYEGARDALKVAGARIIPVPVDEDGLDVTAGVARGPDARAAYITPSHQYPLGMIMSAPRRLQLLEWARKQGAWLFEDDYDSEYRYDGQGLSSLQGLDGDARVIYIGTFSKVLFPSLRVGYLVLPKDLVPRFRRLRGAMDISQEPFHQAVLAELIREGHYARHLRRMRGIYSERRHALERALSGLRISGDNAGMHLVVLLGAKARDHEIALRAAVSGISVIPLSSCFNGKPTRRGLILGYGSTRLSEIPEAVRRLKSLIE